MVSINKENADNGQGPAGCYLVFEPASGGRLMLVYSRGEVPENAVGFWTPSPQKPIQGFKYKQHGGRVELIKGIAGGDSNRRKYFTGWCQFIKLARARDARLIKFPGMNQGVEVDIYGYSNATNQPVFLQKMDQVLVDIGHYDAIAVMPRHHAFLKGVKSIAPNQFLELGNLAGASTTM